MPRRLSFLSTLSALLFGFASAADVPADRLERGRTLYERNCLQCHQANGAGIPGAFPPLAKSDSLAANLDRAIRAVCEGLSAKITVNGLDYNGVMPPVVLNDAAIAEVLTYVLNAWGNPGGELSADAVREVRATTKFPTYEKQALAADYPALPPAPAGFTLREVIRLPQKAVRLASDGTGRTLFVLCETGDVWLLDLATGAIRQILFAKDYLEKRPGDFGGPLFVLAMTLDREGRLYLGSNQQNTATFPGQNIVTIYRTTRFVDGVPAAPQPWFQTSYDGRPSYIHAVEHIAFGPDGLLYVGNGARTDGGFSDADAKWAGGGETPITASLWRIDPRAEKTALEVYARGIRNAYGFCWNDRGEMFATENGPDAHAPEEFNLIVRGAHYGFPYRFADWTQKAYDRTPDAPPGLAFTLPIPNLGPDGGFDPKRDQPTYTFDPHSCPGGLVFLGDDFPAGWRGTFLTPRFGVLIHTPADNEGFDVLRLTLSRDAAGKYQAHVHQVLAPLGRPIDVHLAPRGRVFILEYSRGTRNGQPFTAPGRILELAVAHP